MNNKLLSKLFIGVALLALAGAAATAQAAGLAIIAHPSNTLAGITADEASRIFLGKSRTFPNGKRAIPVDQKEGESMRDKFYAKVVGKNPRELKSYWAKQLFTGKARPPEEVGGDEAVKEWVSKNAEGIGYIDSKLLDRSVKVLLIVP